MSLTTAPTTAPTKALPAAVLETVLPGLAALFLTGTDGDIAAARHAACQMLADYHPETENELRLAANIIAFSFHALEALGQASAPGVSLTRVLRLRGSAVSLSRESAKAERRLGQLQKARQQPIPQARVPDTPPDPVQAAPKIGKHRDLTQDTASVVMAGKANQLALARAEEDRQRDRRIAAGLERLAARATARSNGPIQDAVHTMDQPPRPNQFTPAWQQAHAGATVNL